MAYPEFAEMAFEEGDRVSTAVFQAHAAASG
jgi:hypothetical protein